MARTKGPAYKMKSAAHGGPMRRNFTSAFKDTGDHEHPHTPPVEGGTLSTVEVSGGKGGKSAAQRAYELRLEKQAAEEMARGTITGSPREDYKTAYTKLPEEKKIAYRQAAQKRKEEL